MSKLNQWKTTTALFIALNIGAEIVIPFAIQAPAVAQSNRFSDISQNYWAADFINSLVERGIIAGFPDGSFQADAPVTRAQFAAMVTKAFPKADVRSAVNFVDVPSNFWANSAIKDAYQEGFLAGYPGMIFKPDQKIPREQVLVSLANGLNNTASNNVNNILSIYDDSDQISNFARAPIAAATEQEMVVNYPRLSQLNPTRNATRAEVAAFIYQALVSENKAPLISSQYIVATQPIVRNLSLPAGTRIPVSYQEEKILLAKDETAEITLIVPENIKTRDGAVVIPSGSQITGEMKPVGEGTQFVAEQLTLTDGSTLFINANSAVITKTETVSRGMNVGKLVRNTAISTAAAAGIAAITGDKAIATEELLIGAGAGVLATLIPQFLGLNQVELLAVEPNTDLGLTLEEDLVMPLEGNNQ